MGVGPEQRRIANSARLVVASYTFMRTQRTLACLRGRAVACVGAFGVGDDQITIYMNTKKTPSIELFIPLKVNQSINC